VHFSKKISRWDGNFHTKGFLSCFRTCEQAISPMSVTRKCPDCPQSQVVLNERKGSYICTDCAGEVGGRFISEESEVRVFSDDKDGHSAPIQRNNANVLRNGTQVLPEFGLSTSINSQRKSEYTHIYRHFDGRKQQALRCGIALCSRFSASLHLPAHISDQAIQIYVQGMLFFYECFFLYVSTCTYIYIFSHLRPQKKVIEHDLIKRKPEATMMACLLLSAKKNQHEISLKGNISKLVFCCACTDFLILFNLFYVIYCLDACAKVDMNRKYIVRRWKEIKRVGIHN
jgi:hypothetical protein